ncbi:MAG: PBP1A family penicillin-binding protein [Desulforhopalus sp.]
MSRPKQQTTKKKPARKPAVRRRVYTEKHISIFLIIICLIQTAFLGSLLFILFSLRIPDISSVARYQPAQATIIYDSQKIIAERMFTENRTVVPLEAMSPLLPKAFVAAEDGRFYEHPGLDFFSVLRAAINNFRGKARGQGGSTITQQVAKSLLLTPEKTYVRKFKEAILAWRIDNLLSKDEILYIYLNQIYLGEGAYGIEAAAQIYFGKSAGKLTLSECALLAGLPQAPNRYSLFDHLDRAVERQKYVLNRMAADGYVSAAEAKRAYASAVTLNRRSQHATEENGYYLEVVKKQARAILGGPLQTAGARIYTHLDSRLQKHGHAAVRRGVRANLSRQTLAGNTIEAVPQGALVCIETASARVRALVGGTSFKKSPFDRASQAKRPAGSTFKPFVFTAALNQGWSPQSLIEDSPLSISGKDGKSWSPKNYSDIYHGQTTLADALSHSLNAATVRIMQKTGYKEVHKVARKAGFTSNLPPDLSLALGAADVTLLEMTAAYTPFAGDGSFIPPSFIRKIVLADGTVIFPENDRRRQTVAGQEVMNGMRNMLQGVVTNGTGRTVADVSGVRGGKTGTSNANRDAWFIGYDARYTTGVWIGNDRNQSMGTHESGGSTAAPVWRDFMLKVNER